MDATMNRMTRPTPAMYRRLNLPAGFLLILEFSTTGGTTYRREKTSEEQEDEKLRSEYHTIKNVDHVQLQRDGRALVNRAYHIVDKHGVHTPLGYWVSAESLAKIEAELEPVREASEGFNALARQVGSERRTQIRLFPLHLAEDNESASVRIAQDIVDRLWEIKDTLAAADRKGFEQAMDKAKNLDKMAVGIQADALRMALEHAKATKTQILEAQREGFTAEQIAPMLDLDPINAAIVLFQV